MSFCSEKQLVNIQQSAIKPFDVSFLSLFQSSSQYFQVILGLVCQLHVYSLNGPVNVDSSFKLIQKYTQI
jgi:hypothetical protein